MTMTTSTITLVSPAKPAHVSPVQWQQSIAIARQACARIFRDGGTPADAAEAFGLDASSRDWSRVVEAIAESLSAPQLRRAA